MKVVFDVVEIVFVILHETGSMANADGDVIQANRLFEHCIGLAIASAPCDRSLRQGSLGLTSLLVTPATSQQDSIAQLQFGIFTLVFQLAVESVAAFQKPTSTTIEQLFDPQQQSKVSQRQFVGQ